MPRCLDCLPGDVRAGEAGGKDHPANLIKALQALPQPLPSRNAVVDYCIAAGAFYVPLALKCTLLLQSRSIIVYAYN